MNYFCRYLSCIGEIFLISDGIFLLSLEIGKLNYLNLQENKTLEIFVKAKNWLDAYFKGEEPKDNLFFKFSGTDFQKEVWNMLLEIPYGKTITYGELAEQIALKRNMKKMSAQAIGNAVHKNPLPIFIPCHRVVGKNKNLVGYGLGMDLKIKLLEFEGICLEGYYFYNNKKKNIVK